MTNASDSSDSDQSEEVDPNDEQHVRLMRATKATMVIVSLVTMVFCIFAMLGLGMYGAVADKQVAGYIIGFLVGAVLCVLWIALIFNGETFLG